MRVVIDAMGSDRAPIPEVAGALRAAATHAIDITLVGDRVRLEAELARASTDAARNPLRRAADRAAAARAARSADPSASARAHAAAARVRDAGARNAARDRDAAARNMDAAARARDADAREAAARNRDADARNADPGAVARARNADAAAARARDADARNADAAARAAEVLAYSRDEQRERGGRDVRRSAEDDMRSMADPNVRRRARDRITIVAASEVVTMHDHPAQAFRAKPDSSMRRAVELVAAGQGDAVVSAGNSGAMLAASIFVLGRLAGIERPAIVTVLPTPSGPLTLCDAGANVEPKASQLAQFGVLGAAYDRVVHGRARPRLGLLANGSEPGKGTPLTREAHALLSAATGPFQYVGYVEGSDLFRGVVDVIATDGFTGNIVLKTCEGIAEGLFGLVRQELDKTPRARLGAALVAPALRGLAKRIDYSEIGGALLAGVARPAVIAHGRSDANAIASAIRAAAQFAERSLPDQLATALSVLG